MESFNEKMLEIAGSVTNKHLQLSFYDLQHFLVYSTSTPEVISKNQIETAMNLFAKASLEICEQINKVLEESESDE